MPKNYFRKYCGWDARMVKLGKSFYFNIMAIGAFCIPVLPANASVFKDLKSVVQKQDATKTSKKKEISYSDEAASNEDVSRDIYSAKDIKITKTQVNKKPKNTKNLEKEIIAEKSKTENKSSSKPIITKQNLPKTEMVSEAQMMVELGLTPKDVKLVSNKVSTKPNGVAPWQKVGSPYQVNGIWYIPNSETEYDEIGTASWYGDKFHGKPTANGETFDMNEVSIAHPTLPLPCIVEVVNLENGRSIIARVNDRGPFIDDRLIDISKRGAELLGFKDKGKAKVRVKYVGFANPSNEKQQTIFALNKLNPKTNNQNILLAKTDEPIKPIVKQIDKNLVQVGAFINKEYAEKFIATRPDAANLKIVESETQIGKFFRVYSIKQSAQMQNSKKPVQKIDHNSILASL